MALQGDLFDAVPQHLIAAGDTDAAARHVVDCLYPPVAAQPDQAMGVLLDTVSVAGSSDSPA